MIDPRLDVFGGLDDFVQFAKSKAYVASYSDVGDFVFIQFRRIDIDVDDFGIFGKRSEVAGNAIVETHAQRKKQIAIANCVICIGSTMHSEHVQAQGIFGRENAQAHDRHDDGDSGFLGEFSKFFRSLGSNDPTPAVDHWFFAMADCCCDLADLFWVGIGVFGRGVSR